jgi:DNA-binding GntR family transcriptional regulator
MAVQKNNLKTDFDKLISQLENMILVGIFQPRERLPELKLANELGVSRFRIRDALKILETKGLIEVIPYKGAIVCDLDDEEIEEIFEIRVHLEALAVRKAAVNIKKEDIDFLERMARQFEKAVRRNDFSEMITTNTNFHDYILKLSRNRNLIQIIQQMQARCHILRYHAWSSPEIIDRIQKEHHYFITGLKNKDYELLDDLSKKHISYSKNSYLLHLKARQVNVLDS